MATELEELKQRQDALEEVVRQLEHRLTMDEYQLKSIAYMGPRADPADAEGPDGRRPAKLDTLLDGMDSMLRSVGLNQGFHANHLKDVERELKELRVKQEHLHDIAVMRTEGPLGAIAEGVERVERVIREIANRGTP